MRKFLTVVFFLVAAYAAAYMGDYSHNYIANAEFGWSVNDLKNLYAGPGWFGGFIFVVAVKGTIACGLFIARAANGDGSASELEVVGYGFGLLAAAWAFGALVGPFEAYGLLPYKWLESRLVLMAIICVWPFLFVGVEALLESLKVQKEADLTDNVTSIGRRSA